MKKSIGIVVFDDFTDIDLFLAWDLYNRVDKGKLNIEILGQKDIHTSINGISINPNGRIERASSKDAVLICSGPGTRRCIKNENFLSALNLNPRNQLVASQCSGSLILAKLGLLQGLSATTYSTTKNELSLLGVKVEEKPFIALDNIATAGGCLSGIYLGAWLLAKLFSRKVAESALLKIAPVGQETDFLDLVWTQL